MFGRFFRKSRGGPGAKRYQVVDWPPVGAGPAAHHNWGGGGRRKSYRGTFLRVAAALVIFGVFLAAKDVPGPFGGQVRENLRYILTTEWNWQPFFQKAVQIGLQMVNENYPFYSGTVRESRETLGRAGAGEELVLPVSGKVVRGFGWSTDPLDGLERFHPGIDIKAPSGAPVKAARSGKVARAGKDPSLGYFLLLNHGEGTYTLYAGLAAPGTGEGEEVSAGQVIGEVGAGGDVPGGGLHFELREKGRLVDPLTRLKAAGD